jgi:hypothetical protein
MDIERLRARFEIDPPSLMMLGELPLANVLFVKPPLPGGYEILAEIQQACCYLIKPTLAA